MKRRIDRAVDRFPYFGPSVFQMSLVGSGRQRASAEALIILIARECLMTDIVDEKQKVIGRWCQLVGESGLHGFSFELPGGLFIRFDFCSQFTPNIWRLLRCAR